MAAGEERAQKVLLIGATGAIGKYITDALVASKDKFQKIGIFTSEGTLKNKPALIEKLRAEGLDVIAGDVADDKSVVDAYQGYDTVVSAVGRDAIEKQINLIRLAQSTPNIKRFLPSEYGTDVEYDASSASEKTHQKKLQVRAALRSDTASHMKYSFVVSGPFAEFYLANMPHRPEGGTFDVANKAAVLLGDGTGKINLMCMRDVGRAVVGALLHPEVSDNRALKVTSFTTTPNDILAEFEKQTGSKWKVSYTSLEKLKELETEAWNAGSPVGTLLTLRRIWTEGKTLYSQLDNEAIGLTNTETLEQAVEEVIKKTSA